jgi:hypothetical protein
MMERQKEKERDREVNILIIIIIIIMSRIALRGGRSEKRSEILPA